MQTLQKLVVVGARHVVAALAAKQFAFTLVEAQAAYGAKQHGFVAGLWRFR
jgi:hypothetical protein